MKSFWIKAAFSSFIILAVVYWAGYESQTKENIRNCEEVNHDMTIKQVVEIMGKPDNVKTFQGKIDYKDMKIIKYYYDAPSGSSVGVNIFFDAQSKKVVRAECKD